MNKILYIVGPTASGKTALAINIAKKYNGEIICADSRTIYKGLNIGTAKPDEIEQDGIKHYGLNLVYPNESFSAAQFARAARGWIEGIEGRGKLPIIVGGTGLYIDALYYSYSFSDKADPKLRSELESLSLEELHKIIISKGYEMPENFKNKRYVIRAIERAGEIVGKNQPNANSVIVGLYPGKEILENRIDKRSKVMLETGVVEECERLFGKYGYESPGGSGNIYRALAPHFREGVNLDECMDNFKVLDKRLAKRQMTWFRRNKDINWFNGASEAEKYLSSIL